jgi:hypothetical protein
LLLITPERAPSQKLAGVPQLVGESGLVRQRPALFPREPAQVREIAAAIDTYLRMGRLYAAPAGLPDALGRCLEQGVWAALNDAGFRAAAERAGRSLAIAPADQVRREIAATREAIARVVPIALEAERRAR